MYTSGNESLLAQSFKAFGESMRTMANLMDALALANAEGKDTDLLKPSDVMKLLNCSDSKARQIVRGYGIGKGKMGRIERGRVIQLLKDGGLK